MVPIALGLGTGRSASVADLAVHALLAACVGRQQFLRVRESAQAALENCPGSEMGSTARTVAEQAVDWFAPLRPPKGGPPNPSRASALPHDGWSVHCFNSVPVAVARSRAASDPSPKYTMLISILHPSSGDATYQVGLNTSKKRTMAKVNPGPAPPRASTRCSRDPCQEGGSPDNTTIRG